MGTYQSLFAKNEEQSKIILVPNKGDFITGHADLTGCNYYITCIDYVRDL